MSAPAALPERTDPRVRRSRARVLAAAVELIVERGIAGTTIEAVAERSGVARTTVYRHWPDQAALVRDAFATTLDPPPTPDTGTVRGDLVALVDGLARALAHGPAATLMAALVDAAERDAALAELHRTEAAARHSVALEVLRRGVERGEIGPVVDPRLVVDLLAGPVFHRRWVTRLPADSAFTRSVVDAALHVAAGPQAGDTAKV